MPRTIRKGHVAAWGFRALIDLLLPDGFVIYEHRLNLRYRYRAFAIKGLLCVSQGAVFSNLWVGHTQALFPYTGAGLVCDQFA